MQRLIEFSSLILFCAFLWGGKAHALQFPYPGWCGEGHHIACHAIGTGAVTVVTGQVVKAVTHNEVAAVVSGIAAGTIVSYLRENQKPHYEMSSVRGDVWGILLATIFNIHWSF
ncbi:MAG: hypothetical protein KGI54_17650 [Pseudomonadota bacterium]|nr:hypothetical protein [Pseudomonadota bacterium]